MLEKAMKRLPFPLGFDVQKDTLFGTETTGEKCIFFETFCLPFSGLKG